MVLVRVSRMWPRIADIVEIETSAGLAYAHFTHNHTTPPRHGALIRVLPGLHPSTPDDFSALVLKRPQFMTFFPLAAACNRGITRVVAHEPVPKSGQRFPIFRHSNRDLTGKRVPPWFLWDGEREWRVDRLTEAQLRDYPLRETWDDTRLASRIVAGWSHEMDA